MIKKLLTFLFLASPAVAAYNFTMPLIVNHGQVGGSEANFPVLVQTSNVVFSTAAAGGHMLNSNGYDLVYSTWSDCHYLLHWDTETVNNTGSTQMNAWVQVPSLSNTTDTVFYACYGNAATTTYQGISTATWDANYSGVWHLRTPLSGNDSTVNANTPSSLNGTTSTSGQIDGAASFDGSTNYIQYSDATVLHATSNLTISVWVYQTSYAGSGGNQEFIKKDGNYIFRQDSNSFVGSGVIYDLLWFDGSNLWAITAPVASLNAWHYVVVTVSGNVPSAIYVDGSLISTSASILFGAGQTLTNPLTFGAQSGGGEYLVGNEDDPRISLSARTSDWILTEFNSQNSPSTFLVFDTEVNNALLAENQKGLLIRGGRLNIRGGRVSIR